VERLESDKVNDFSPEISGKESPFFFSGENLVISLSYRGGLNSPVKSIALALALLTLTSSTRVEFLGSRTPA
jgi:hypothetical protein